MPENEMFWAILIVSLIIVLVLSMLAVLCASVLLGIISKLRGVNR